MKIHHMWKLSQLNKNISQVNKVMTMFEKGSINFEIIKETLIVNFTSLLLHENMALRKRASPLNPKPKIRVQQ